MKQQGQTVKKLSSVNLSYDKNFYNDMYGVFPNMYGAAPKSGGVGKYIYDGENWNNIVKHSSDFYVPRGDHELTMQAFRDIGDLGVPNGTPYVDFGVGGPASFLDYALPIMQKLGSRQYTGVDYCEKALARIKALESRFCNERIIKTERMDFFKPPGKVVSMHAPALGVMNGITITNMYGTLEDGNIELNLVSAMRYLSKLCGQGWLLLTIDTNQNEHSLRKAYVTPLNSSLYLKVFSRMATELPVEGFDPQGFVYDPEFRSNLQLWAHMARATKTQDFLLGGQPIHVEENQKIHLLNSYKFCQDFFEVCCQKANLSIIKNWSHETGMMLYLLKDKKCSISSLNNGVIH
jgi:uncharacterized SAM-dependent methyltransferase